MPAGHGMLVALALAACAESAPADAGRPDAPPLDAPPADAMVAHDLAWPDVPGAVPCVSGEGGHRLYLQGRGADPDADGRYALLEDREAILHGEHFLLGAGSFVEWAAPLCADIEGGVALYVPNNEDVADVATARFEVLILREGGELPIAEAVDAVYGKQGYEPFTAELGGADPDVRPGDRLLVRATVLDDAWYAVVIFTPPSDYMAWIDVVAP